MKCNQCGMVVDYCLNCGTPLSGSALCCDREEHYCDAECLIDGIQYSYVECFVKDEEDKR